MIRHWLALIVLFSLISGCATQDTTEATESDSDPLASILPPLDESEAERCINLSQVASTRVLDSSTIQFRMRGGKTYINVLPNRCPGLRKGAPFMYRTSQSVLCNLDLISVLDNSGMGMRPMGACGLGLFYPTLETGAPVVLEDEP